MRQGATTLVVLMALLGAACSASIDLEFVDAAAPEASNPEVATTTPTAAPVAPPDGDGSGAPEDEPTAAPAVTPSPTVDPEATGVPEPTQTPEGDPSPTPTPAPDPESTPEATVTPTPAPTATATAEPLPTPGVIEFVIGPDAPLLGVPIGTDADTALNSLIAAIGDPDFDTDWYQGCPLDGEALNERLVQWGDLNVYFERSDSVERFRAWGYDLRIVEGGFPEIDMIQLPGGSQMGDPVNEVAAAAGLAVVYDEVFDINRVGGEGFELISDAPPGAPIWGAFVPGVPVCE